VLPGVGAFTVTSARQEREEKSRRHKMNVRFFNIETPFG
jgi:hypothetical protein